MKRAPNPKRVSLCHAIGEMPRLWHTGLWSERLIADVSPQRSEHQRLSHLTALEQVE